MNLLVRPWRHAFDFSGRSTRREWALFIGVYYVAIFGLLAIASSTGNAAAAVFGTLLGLFMLACLIPWISVCVRRLHDHDKTGWLLLIAFVPFFGWIFYLIMMLTPGTEEANSYGNNPRHPETGFEDAAEIFA